MYFLLLFTRLVKGQKKVRKSQKLAYFPALPYLPSCVDNCRTTLLSINTSSEGKSQGFEFYLRSRQQSHSAILSTSTVSARILIHTLF